TALFRSRSAGSSTRTDWKALSAQSGSSSTMRAQSPSTTWRRSTPRSPQSKLRDTRKSPAATAWPYSTSADVASHGSPHSLGCCVAWLLPIHGDVASHGSSPFMGRWRRRRRRGWCDLVICAVRGLFRPRSARTASVDLRQLVAAVLFLGVGAACQSAATATPTPSPVGLVNSSPLCRGVHLLADRQRMDLAIFTWQRTGTGYRPAATGLVGSRAVTAVIERPQADAPNDYAIVLTFAGANAELLSTI